MYPQTRSLETCFQQVLFFLHFKPILFRRACNQNLTCKFFKLILAEFFSESCFCESLFTCGLSANGIAGSVPRHAQSSLLSHSVWKNKKTYYDYINCKREEQGGSKFNSRKMYLCLQCLICV